VKEKIGHDNFYIIAINDQWKFCDEYDYAFTSDESVVFHFLQFEHDKILLTGAFSKRLNNNRTPIPYCWYKNQVSNLICISNIVFKGTETYESLSSSHQGINGKICMDIFSKLGFKFFFTIGFGGTGQTQLVSFTNVYRNSIYGNFQLFR